MGTRAFVSGGGSAVSAAVCFAAVVLGSGAFGLGGGVRFVAMGGGYRNLGRRYQIAAASGDAGRGSWAEGARGPTMLSIAPLLRYFAAL